MTIITRISQALQDVMLQAAEKHEDKFIQRKREVTGQNFCQTTVFGWLMEPECSAEGLAQIAREFGLNISAQGLDQRFTQESAEFLKQILAETVKHRIETDQDVSALLTRFDRVYVADSSSIGLPDALADIWQGCGNGHADKGNSTLKLQVRWELKSGGIDGPHLFDGRLNDNRAIAVHPSVAQGCLTINDRGYWSIKRFAAEDANGALWLSYVRQNTRIIVEGVDYGIADYLRTCSFDELDLPIKLGKNYQLSCRLLAMRVPDQLAQSRRRRLKYVAKNKGRTVSTKQLVLCDWVVMVTNVPTNQLTVAEAVSLIRVRWQIELLFKLWKSFGQIDKSRSCDPWRILCQLYAKMIGMVLLHWILLASVWQFPDRSLFKAAQVIRRHIFQLALSLFDRLAIERVATTIINSLQRGCRIKRSQKQPRSFQLLMALEGNGA